MPSSAREGAVPPMADSGKNRGISIDRWILGGSRRFFIRVTRVFALNAFDQSQNLIGPMMHH
jgi:hypothetical protein